MLNTFGPSRSSPATRLQMQLRPFLASAGHRESRQASACHREWKLATEASQATQAERAILGQLASSFPRRKTNRNQPESAQATNPTSNSHPDRWNLSPQNSRTRPEIAGSTGSRSMLLAP
jgi:hypothetical protein